MPITPSQFSKIQQDKANEWKKARKPTVDNMCVLIDERLKSGHTMISHSELKACISHNQFSLDSCVQDIKEIYESLGWIVTLGHSNISFGIKFYKTEKLNWPKLWKC